MSASVIKWTKVVLRYTNNIMFFGQRPKSSSKGFFMMTSMVVLNNQVQNSKLRSSKLIIKSDAQKQIVESSFGRKIHVPKYFKVGFLFFSYSLNSSHTSGHHHKLLQKTTNLMSFYSIVNKFQTIACSTSPTCTSLLKHVEFS